jgi:hypothetical protein
MKKYAIGGGIDPDRLTIRGGVAKGTYDRGIVTKVIEESLKRHVNPELALAVAHGESRIGNLHHNIGQTTGNYNSGDPAFDLVTAISDKAEYARKLDKRGRYRNIPSNYNNDEAKTLIAYNGFRLNRGNDSGSNKVYGVTIPAGGIDMVKTPLYAKKILNTKKAIAGSPEYQAVKKQAAEGLKNKYNMFQQQDYNKGEWRSDPSIYFNPTLHTQYASNTSPKYYKGGGKIGGILYSKNKV